MSGFRLLLLIGLLPLAQAQRVANPGINVPSSPPATSVGLENAFPGLSFTQPVCLASPPGETQRLFVCEKGGALKVIHDVTASTLTATTFLNLGVSTTSESGLLGLAFHPDYAVNRHFYVFYSVNSGGLKQRVSRFTTRADNPLLADSASELILINQADEAGNHNGGDLHFGPDGYLYISVGDEGGGNDEFNNAQIITKDLFGGILRIDVDKLPGNPEPNDHPAITKTGGVAPFSIPADNPFVLPAGGGTWDGTYNGSAIPAGDLGKVRTEFYATGLRNPWRMSFDVNPDDPDDWTLWCGDVGQGAREEIDHIVKGGNYGWAYYEGGITGPKIGQAPSGFDSSFHIRPIYDYERGSGTFQGNSVTGGLVYRGTRIGSLIGKYIFGDHVSGNIWSLEENEGDPPTVTRLTGEGGVAAFGSDPSNGDVLVCDYNSNSYGGAILRMVSQTQTGAFPATLTATGLFQDVAQLTPAASVTPYEVNLPFWSDHALKRRWFTVPDGVSTFAPAEEDPWDLPSGAIWVKHFDLELERGNPATAKRIETRLIVKNTTGAYGVSYRWNEAGTEASLAADAGEDIPLEIMVDGEPVSQTWRIPSRAECMICHTPQAGHALSFNTRQLNREGLIEGMTGNQITALHGTGYLSDDPGPPLLLPRHLRADEAEFSMEARARSYLAVNCSGCHQDDGGTPSSWDVRAHLKLADTGILSGDVTNDGGNPARKLIVPGDADLSVMLLRMAATDGFSRMPPVGVRHTDEAGVQLLTDWIEGELANRRDYAEWRLIEFGSPDSPEGEPGEDADGDGVTNHAEYLAGTSPQDGSDFFKAGIHQAGEGDFNLSFHVPANRSFRIHTSETLVDWDLWEIPQNHGLPVAGGLVEIVQPLQDPKRFFKVELREN